MPGLFSQIAAVFSGGDDKLVTRIDEFAEGYVVQGDVARALALKREETALLDALLAEELYRSYCAAQPKGKECSPKAVAHFEAARKEREAQVGLTGESLERLEAALKTVAGELATLARQKGKFDSSFASVDGLTESLANEAIATRVADVKAAKRATLH